MRKDFFKTLFSRMLSTYLAVILGLLLLMGVTVSNMFKNQYLQEEEQSNILTLTDETGTDVDFEYLDSVDYEGKEYLVLMPADELATEIVILEVEPVDEETENDLSVSDETILNAVYGIFKERYKDVLTFED